MFGKNKILPTTYGSASKATQEEKEGRFLLVNSIFYTIQGEGPYAGEPAVFIRLTGCNLRCFFCDTEFETGSLQQVELIVKTVQELAGDVCRLVVLTGGEPMRQQIIPLCCALADAEFTTQIETAGTVVPPTINDTGLRTLVAAGDVDIVCSPKTAVVHSLIEELCHHYKYIIRAPEWEPPLGSFIASDGLPMGSTQQCNATTKLFRPSDPAASIWVQPCMEYTGDDVQSVDTEATDTNMRHATELALKHGYRVSLQLHKYLGVE